MSNKNNKNSLSDRMNNPDRMSRVMDILITAPIEKEIVNTNENALIDVKDETLDIANENIIIQVINDTNTNDNINNIVEVLEKPLIKPLINIEPNNIDKDIVIDNDKAEVNIVTNVKTKPITKSNNESLAETINRMVAEIERLQMEELSPLSLLEDKSKKKDKIKFDDRNPILSFPARPELEKIINLIYERTGVKKYKIFELLIVNGLKSTAF